MIEVTERHGQLGVCAALLAIGLYGIAESSSMPMGSVALPGPGVFPLALSILLCVATLGVLVEPLPPASGRSSPVALLPRPVLLAFAALCAVALLLDRVGFLLTMTAFLLVLYGTFSKLGWLRSAVAAALSAFALWAFFAYAIGVPLPRGELF